MPDHPSSPKLELWKTSMWNVDGYDDGEGNGMMYSLGELRK